MSTKLIQFSFLIFGLQLAINAQAQVQTDLHSGVARTVQALKVQNESSGTETEKIRNKMKIVENLKNYIFDNTVPSLKGKPEAEKYLVAQYQTFLLMIPSYPKETLNCRLLNDQFQEQAQFLKSESQKSKAFDDVLEIVKLICP